MPANREDLVIQRILIRHGFTAAMAETLLQEMREVLDHLVQNPPETSSAPVLAGAEASSHDHSGR